MKQFDQSDSFSVSSSRFFRRSKRYQEVKLKLPGSPFIRILQRLRQLEHRDSDNKRFQKKQFDHSNSSSGGRKIIGRHHRSIDLNDTNG
ncbi:uncharacterized protein [Primulina huaijiensis]|uniref:uncharacterized protein isoform X3 n=1 Tax=Primulina huaijiensis TaxID=1492673 RepID=UPI003CC72A01